MIKYSLYTAAVFFRFKKLLFLGSFLILSLVCKSSKLEKAFEALKMYDYFLAKKIFTEIQQKKTDAYCSYGLSLIYSRTDNPFSDIDSAGKYIRLSYHTFQTFHWL